MKPPVFKGPIEGYVVNFLTKNLWRVARTHERDDALQEAYLIYMRCCQKYPDVDTEKHFMALFKTAWVNHFTDLANKDTKVRTSSVVGLGTEADSYAQGAVGELDNSGALVTMLRQAPREVVMVVNLFLNAPQELLELATCTWAAGGRGKSTETDHVAKMLGLPQGTDPLGATKAYFGDTTN